MQILPSDVRRAMAAAVATASGLGLEVHEAIPVHVSNRLALRLQPSESLARVASSGHEAAPFEIELATRLARTNSPVEFDLAHVPEAVSQRYPDVDQLLLQHCRVLVLAMVAAWRLDPEDQLPSGRHAATELLTALRAGPPYPSLGAITGLK